MRPNISPTPAAPPVLLLGLVGFTQDEARRIESQLHLAPVGGVHWRTDNTRSLTLGEAVAAHILADITKDLAEKPIFTFRTFSRKNNGKPKVVVIRDGKIKADGETVSANASAL